MAKPWASIRPSRSTRMIYSQPDKGLTMIKPKYPTRWPSNDACLICGTTVWPPCYIQCRGIYRWMHPDCALQAKYTDMKCAKCREAFAVLLAPNQLEWLVSLATPTDCEHEL